MNNKLLLIAALSTLLLTACGNSEQSDVSKETSEDVKVEVATEEVSTEEEAQTNNETLNEVANSGSSNDGNNIGIDATGDYKIYSLPKQLNEEVYSTDEDGFKIYDEGSNAVHENFQYNITGIESVKYLESEATSNVLRADDGEQYIIVQIIATNIGDRVSSSSSFDKIQPKLYVYDENGEVLDSAEMSDETALYYLEQYDQEQLSLGGIERNAFVPYVLAYSISSDVPVGSQLVLYQRSNISYKGTEYKLPIAKVQ
ncbi:hypothetical protein LG296_21115 (plasmid) [Ureibacillus chungkukjangi]|uniref:hypothetical protein n=1 Tax=Ureibacillus chungkukjangi TaxID=1202712 RepID=UPI000D3CD3CA|nr:hypothetical protein [Ureibacillus chungkukjangi]MCM3390691.1 hypothetical protein [Ureibacillus chungkukjangi]